MTSRLSIAALVAAALLCACQAKPSTVAQTGTPAPSSAQQYAYVTVPAASPAPAPRILEVDLSAQRYRAPAVVDVQVKTSPDVSSVIVRLLGREASLPRVGAGLFSARRALPDVPFFLKGRTYSVQFVAATDDGRTASAAVNVYLER